MAIYHLHVGFVSRSTGRSAVQVAAYITGSKMTETRRGMEANYENRVADVAYTQTFFPTHVPSEFHDPHIWDKIENFEDSYAFERFSKSETSRLNYQNSAQTAMTVVVALPLELALLDQKKLLKEFIADVYLSRNLIVTVAIHDDDEANPHAHLLISRRSMNEKGELSWAKDRDICTKSSLRMVREHWANLSNTYLEKAGLETRITHKSFKDQGLDLEPSQHRGWYADKLQKNHMHSRLVIENEDIFLRNKARIIDNPAIILDECVASSATFTQKQLVTLLQKRIGEDSDLIPHILQKALSHAVCLGEDLKGNLRYTTPTYLEAEKTFLKHTQDLLAPRNEALLEDSTQKINTFLEKNDPHLKGDDFKEQRTAILGLCDDNKRVCVLVGRAGSGKTTTLKTVSAFYREQGFKVMGTSVSALAAHTLGASLGPPQEGTVQANMQSRTLASLLYRFKMIEQAQEKFLNFNAIMTEGLLEQLEWYKILKNFEREKLDAQTLVVMDEASMVNLQNFKDLLSYIKKYDAKLIIVGDDHQLEPIGAGDPFRVFCEKAENSHILFKLSTIRRQQIPWMAEASMNLAEMKTQEGLMAYERAGHVHKTEDSFFITDIATSYIQSLQNYDSHAFNPGAILAFTNKDVDTLNAEVRALLRYTNTVTFKNHTGQTVGLCEGDVICFLKNHQNAMTFLDGDGQTLHDSQGVSNGSRGIVTQLQGDSVKVQLEDNRFVTFSLKDYTHLCHGYALTIHKSQGQTLPFTTVALSPYMDAKALYVALTRHRHDTQIFFNTKDFETVQGMALHLSRFDSKDMSSDYQLSDDKKPYFERVQNFTAYKTQAAFALNDARKSNFQEKDLEIYKALQKQYQDMGHDILKDFNNHKVFVHQQGLSKEKIEIMIGIKKRPLSLAQEKGKLNLQLYAAYKDMARDVLCEIQVFHEKTQKTYVNKAHPLYPTFQDYKKERDSLAREILDNPQIYEQLLYDYGKELNITQKSLEKQVYYSTKNTPSQHSVVEHPQDHQPKHLSEHPKGYTKEDAKEFYDVMASIFDTDRPRESQTEQSPTPSPSSSQSSKAQSSTVYPKGDYVFAHTPSEIIEALQDRCASIAEHLLGPPQKRLGYQYRYGNKGSICITVAGPDKGRYANFETGVFGHILQFIQEQQGLNSAKEAFKWGVTYLGYDTNPRFKEKVTTVHHDLSVKQEHQDTHAEKNITKQKDNGKEWKTITPNIQKYPVPNLYQDPKLSYMVKGKKEVARYAYTDKEGVLQGYVLRLEDDKKNKITPPLTFCENKKGHQEWRYQGFGGNRPLYHLKALYDHPQKRVLLVEGEKTCHAAQKMMDGVCLTWMGGCGAVHKTDWSPLKDRVIDIFPDHDEAGHKAALSLVHTLRQQGVHSIRVLDLPASFPHKWDLADPLPEGQTIQTIQNNYLVSDQTYVFKKEKEALNNKYKTFPFEEMRTVAKAYGLKDTLTYDREPLAQFVAHKTYKELYQWTKLHKASLDEKELSERAILAGIYSSFGKERFMEEFEDQHPLTQAQWVGGIASRIAFNEKHGRVKNKEKNSPFETQKSIFNRAIDEFESLKLGLEAMKKEQYSMFTFVSETVKNTVIENYGRCYSLLGHFHGQSHDVAFSSLKPLVDQLDAIDKHLYIEKQIHNTLQSLPDDFADEYRGNLDLYYGKFHNKGQDANLNITIGDMFHHVLEQTVFPHHQRPYHQVQPNTNPGTNHGTNHETSDNTNDDTYYNGQDLQKEHDPHQHSHEDPQMDLHHDYEYMIHHLAQYSQLITHEAHAVKQVLKAIRTPTHEPPQHEHDQHEHRGFEIGF